MVRVMHLSDSPFTITGFANQSWQMLNGLAKQGHDCHFLAHNYLGQTHDPGTKVQNTPAFNFSIHGSGNEAYMKDRITQYIRKYRPDVFGVLLDTFMVKPFFEQLDLAPANTYFYFPSDGGGCLPLGCESILRKVNYPVAMSKFAKQQAFEVHGITTHYIPHGVDTTNYFPLKNKEEIKAKFGLQGKFVFGTVARNQGRKMLDRTVKAFAKFAKTHPDAILFMHSDPEDRAAIFHMPSLIQKLGIQNRVRWSGMRAFNGFTYQQMNEVFNAMDCHLLTTSGEGFGVPTIEASACGVPSIVTDYTTTRELIIDDIQCGLAAGLVGTPKENNPNVHSNQILNGTITGSWMVERGVMDIDDCVKKMEELYADKKLREELGKNGVRKIKKYYDWEVVHPQWQKLINQMMK